MSKSIYPPTAIAVTLLLVAGALATAGERELQQSQSIDTVQTTGSAEAAQATAVTAARMLIIAAHRAENPQEARSYLNQVFALDLPQTSKALSMAHNMMADLLADTPEVAAGHRELAEQALEARRQARRNGESVAPGVAKQSRTAINQAATIVRMAQHATGQREAMIWMQRALDMDLPADDPQVRRLLYTAHITFADSYADSPAKRAHHLAQAALYVSNPAERARLESEIELLGGAPVIAGPGSPEAALTPGVGDNCFDGTTVPAFTMTGQTYSDVLSISAPGDNDWYTVTVDTGDSRSGVTLRIETISDNPGNPMEDDTRLWLYTDCDDTTGDGINLIEFDDDGGDNFMSLINTQCLPNDTYYLRVNGWEEVSLAENITLEIDSTSECPIVAPDAFEDDNDRSLANEIVAGAAPQDKSITPDTDEDWNWFDLDEPRLTRISTTGASVDAALSVLYATENVPVAGLCNNRPAGVVSTAITNGCNTDADCPDNIDPVPDLPACLPWDLFTPPLVDPVDNPLASAVGGAAELTLCLPSTARPSQSESVDADPADPFHWFVRVASASTDLPPCSQTSPDGGGPSGPCFDYEIQLEDLGPCPYESSPNDDFATANDVPPGGVISGLFDYSAFAPAGGDKDFFAFDVPAASSRQLWRIATDSYDDTVDSFIELWVGPDEAGDFLLVEANDDGGPGNLAAIERELIPAAMAIPNPAPDASYFANVTATNVGPNFPYDLSVVFISEIVVEDGDFADCDSPLSAGLVGPPTVISAIMGDCDYDGYRFTLASDRNLTIVTDTADAAGDTVIQLVKCGTDEILSCDEDSNPACASAYCSQMVGCVPGGEDYCVRVRPFSSGAVFEYDMDIVDNGPCDAGDPDTDPPISGDGIGQCRDDGLGRDRFNGTACTSDYTYSECAAGPVDPVFCEDPGGFPQCDLPCPDPNDECVTEGDACRCGPLLVTMESMTATQTADGVLITWTTASEVDTVGFRVLREDLGSRQKSLVPRVISDWISASGSPLDGATYSFIDAGRHGAKSINFYIEDVDSFNRVTRHGPITFVPTSTRRAQR